jgi:uncharacterized membrane protein YphA (DoxX/SURF4 family)
VFLSAGIMKMINSERFLSALKNLHAIPTEAVTLIAILLPPVEIVLGFALLLNLKHSLLIALSLNITFSALLFYNYFSGNTGTDCGCFGNLIVSKVDGLTLLRQSTITAANVFLISVMPRERNKNLDVQQLIN